MYVQPDKSKVSINRRVANSVGQQQNNAHQSVGFVDNRPANIVQRRLQNVTNNVGRTGSALPVQTMMETSVFQFERTVTNSQAKNMQESLVRVFGGEPKDYQIDQESGSTFNDNNGNDTTGHHGVTVTDTRDGRVYSCDFHNNGKYYTRG